MTTAKAGLQNNQIHVKIHLDMLAEWPLVEKLSGVQDVITTGALNTKNPQFGNCGFFELWKMPECYLCIFQYSCRLTDCVVNGEIDDECRSIPPESENT